MYLPFLKEQLYGTLSNSCGPLRFPPEGIDGAYPTAVAAQAFAGDLAPKFYPAVSSLLAFGLPCLAVEATGAGAEPLA